MKHFIRTTIIASLCFTLQAFTTQNTSTTYVYICVTGKVYHSTRSCRGLSNATHEIKQVTLEYAKAHRRACRICY